ncbi:CatB-related O-acetyltransferase [Mangrovivirga cuniculi]|uniref:Antibiotic acetyltransferase n=1 Tax=Mangrovivirga cuniculi TaxID=2715131 RepID=A0A4D7JMN4_9BACT|nr:CatB-related O-acetyltransferase [Mangrovivirga cuniculi]QCK15917.1 antibiotic acetyltransferase [Mangrovivirga cuniculi]
MRLIAKIKYRIINKLFFEFKRFNHINLEKGYSIDQNAIIRKSEIKGKVNIAEGCKIIGGVKITGKSPVNIGRYTSLNGPNMDILASVNSVNIGSFCSIARNVSIQEFNHHFDRLTSYYINTNILGGKVEDDIYSKGDIIIGNDVWIGTQSVILSGAKIGNGAIIAANSVVNGEIPPYAIAVGSPAKVIKYRFNQETIDRIEKLEWWNWSTEKILKKRNLFELPVNQIDINK